MGDASPVPAVDAAPPGAPVLPKDDAVPGHDAIARIRAALDGLPSNERDAIILAYFGGCTYRTAAARLGQPEGTIKSRIRTGLRRLGRSLAGPL